MDKVVKALEQLGSNRILTNDIFLPSGSVIFDAAISEGRGIPRGKFIQLTSDSGLGKSTMMLHMCRSLCQRGYVCVYIDTEKSVNDSQIDGIGLREFLDVNFFWHIVDTFEDAERILDSILIGDDNLALVVFDSITGLIPEKMLEESVNKIEPGLHARYVANFLVKYKAMLRRTKSLASIFFINQMRTKLNFKRGSTYEAAGGSAQKFYMDIRFMMSMNRKLVKKTQTSEGVAEVPYGCEVNLWSDKNRFARPFVVNVVTIIFGKGISDLAAYQRWLSNHKFATVAGAWYTITLPDAEPARALGMQGFSKWVRENLTKVQELIAQQGGIQQIEEKDE